MKKSFVFFLILGFSLGCMNLFSEERNALLIANDKYPFGNLSNPVKEAKELKKTLEKLDFKVTVVENGDIDKMESSIEKFCTMLKEKGGIGFFHYGGHAIQVGGKNYLIPANTQMTTENQIRRLSLDLDELMEKMQAETNIVILDACRNNPLPSSTRSVATRGLVLSSVKPKNSIIVYSADAGNVAQDGVFTPILTKKLLEKKSLHSILMNVRSEVYEKTKGQQTPKNDDGLMKEIYLAGLATSPVESKNVVPEWLKFAVKKEEKSVRRILKIPDSERIYFCEVENADESMLERQAEFEAIYEIQSEINSSLSSTISFSESEPESTVRCSSFGNKNAWVAISEMSDRDSQGRKHYSRNLHTPTEEYVIFEATNEDKNVNFVLPEKGSLWVRLAFQEAHPELSKSFRKVAGYKTYNKKTENYQYLAVYVYDLAALKKEAKSVLNDEEMKSS